MKFKILSAAVVAAGMMLGMGATAQQAEAKVNIYIGVPGVYVGPGYYKRGRYHCHRYKVWRNGHVRWVKKCHRHRHRH